MYRGDVNVTCAPGLRGKCPGSGRGARCRKAEAPKNPAQTEIVESEEAAALERLANGAQTHKMQPGAPRGPGGALGAVMLSVVSGRRLGRRGAPLMPGVHAASKTAHTKRTLSTNSFLPFFLKASSSVDGPVGESSAKAGLS